MNEIERKQAVKVLGEQVWCDDEHADAIRAMPGVSYLGPRFETLSRTLFFDPRYDREEVIAAIESVGDSQ